MRAIRVLLVTHLAAILLPFAALLLAFGWLAAEPPVFVGPISFTCASAPSPGGTVFLCGVRVP